MNITDFNFDIDKNEDGFIINDVYHSGFDTYIYFIDEITKMEIINSLIKYVTGEINNIKLVKLLWSDGDYEEPSNDYYVAINNYDGTMSGLIDDINGLVKYIHNKAFKLYRLVVEDDLI